jgi:GT2 family glycosyltransferase
MPDYKNKLAFVVATKDRPCELRNMLKSLGVQSYRPDQVVIVDGSEQSVEKIVQEFPNLRITYLRCIPPSAARQRNLGIESVDSEVHLIGFLDDDIELASDALQKMMDFWENASEDTGGAAFNMINHPQLYGAWLKHLPLTEKLGLYSKDGGKVLPSGFHTMIGYIPETNFVQWLPTGAVLWRRKVLQEFRFDEWFNGYSYLEDLDFSYQVVKKYQLVVVAGAHYYHYPSSTGRDNGYIFGKREVKNRIHFIKKHQELSPAKCYWALITRMCISLSLAIREREASYLKRSLGNVMGMAQVLLPLKKN